MLPNISDDFESVAMETEQVTLQALGHREMSDEDDSRLQAAELIISLASGARPDDVAMSAVPTTTPVSVERLPQTSDFPVLVSVYSGQESENIQCKDSVVVADTRTDVVAGDARGGQEHIVVIENVEEGTNVIIP